MLLEHKNDVIYGAGGAIGGTVARAFAREGGEDLHCLSAVGRIPGDAELSEVFDRRAKAAAVTLEKSQASESSTLLLQLPSWPRWRTRRPSWLPIKPAR
jgi:hypothetical protein